MMDDKTECKIIGFQDGMQALVSGKSIAGVTVSIDDNPISKELTLLVNASELEDFEIKAATNKINFDTIEKNTTIMNQNETLPSISADNESTK